MIILKKLMWSNCFSYGENNVIDLNSNVLTQITGLNGAGKSSLPLIIEEVLFNKNSKGVKKSDLPNRYKDGSYNIVLELEKDGVEYYVDVNRKGASIKVVLVRNGEDISSHTATNTFKTIQEEIIGIDFKTFSQLVYQNTNASLQFLTATDTARKKFLIDLLGLEDYISYFEGFKEVLKAANLELAGVTSSITTVENWLKSNRLEDTQPMEVKSIPSIPKEMIDKAGTLQSEINNIVSTNKRIQRNNQLKSLLSSIDIDKVNSIKETEILPYDHLLKEVGHETSIQSAAKNLISKMKKLHGICPTCIQEIDEQKNNEIIAENSLIVESYQVKIDKINEEISSIMDQNSAYEYKVEKQKEFESLFLSIDKNTPTELINEAFLQKELSKAQEYIKNINTSIKTIVDRNSLAEKHNTRIQVILEQTDKFQISLNEHKSKLVIIEEKVANLEILKKAFSTNGLLAYKIENLVKELEELTNAYLAELSDGRFAIQFVVNNDKLNVEITDNGSIVDILALSSGELARVNTATLLAIRKLMSFISKTKINILFLDEVISVLDEQGKEKLVEILIKEEELNTYLVSHSWQHPLVSKIEIIKYNNISYLE
jgi:DNA repair exonuclease SbcCD ATPase subunit